MTEQIQNEFRVRCLNCRKQPEVLKSLLNDKDTLKYDILCLQELPYFIDSQAAFQSSAYHLILPTGSAARSRTQLLRSAIYVRKTIPSDSYSQLTINSLDITALCFSFPCSESHPASSLSIYSVYNPPKSSSSISTLTTHLNTLPDSTRLMLVGDFNKHHSLWSGHKAPRRTRQSDAEPLIQLLAERNLKLCLPRGTPTRLPDSGRQSATTIDLVFATEETADTILGCQTSSGHGSDHRSIDTTLDIGLPHTKSAPRPQWRAADWEAFVPCVADLVQADSLLQKSQTIDSNESLDHVVQGLSAAFVQATDKAVPIAKESPFAKRWWTSELSAQRHEFKKLQNRAGKPNSTPASRDAARAAGREYQKAIRRQQRRHWKEWVEEATEQSVWQAHKYTSQAPDTVRSSKIPDLKAKDGTMASTNDEKADALMGTFFPEPPPADLGDAEDFQYPEGLDLADIVETEVHDTIMRFKPYKAAGPNKVANIALQKCVDILAPIMTHVINASLKLGYHPHLWKHFSTITLRKPGKPDYTIPKAYRPIALEDTMGKVAESVLATRLAALAEQFQLLPGTHFGGRPGRTTTDAILYLTQRVKDTWRGNGVLSVLFMDISAAFPSVSHARLIHNLKKRNVPAPLVQWIASFLSDRTTTLSFDDFTSPPRHASHGIPQGSPLSPILYLFYSSDLLELVSQSKEDRDKMAAGYIDDTMFAVSSPTVEENVEKLERMAPQLLDWSRTHSCRFDLDKFQLIHFCRTEKLYAPLPININGQSIAASDSAKYLGIVVDRKLKWKEHVEAAIAKGTKAVLAVARLTRPTFGMPHRFVRQLFRSVVIPRMEYGMVAWYQPIRKEDGARRAKGSVGLARQLGKVQRIATRLITGALRTTATDVLDYLASIPPIELRLNLSSFNAAARLTTLPETHPLYKSVRRCSRMYPRRHRSILHELFNAFPELNNLETIDPTPTDPWWTPPFTFHIASSKDEAAEQVAQYADSFCVYTDGSGFENGVGAAAIAKTRCGSIRVRRAFLGPLSKHTVFEGELGGATLGLDIIASEPRITSATILIDNQSSIISLTKRRPQSAQHLVELFHSQLRKLRRQRRTFRLHIAWVPGHSDVEGNELVDEEAKSAAQGNSTALPKPLMALLRPPDSLAALKASRKKALAKEWLLRWRQSERGKRSAKFDPTPPGKQVLKIYKDLPRRACSIITQLRTGHIGLNSYLSRFRIVDSPFCSHCHVPETVDHFLFQCRRFNTQRHSLRKSLGKAPLTRRSLLGGRGHVRELLRYVHDTRRFPLYENGLLIPAE